MHRQRNLFSLGRHGTLGKADNLGRRPAAAACSSLEFWQVQRSRCSKTLVNMVTWWWSSHALSSFDALTLKHLTSKAEHLIISHIMQTETEIFAKKNHAATYRSWGASRIVTFNAFFIPLAEEPCGPCGSSSWLCRVCYKLSLSFWQRAFPFRCSTQAAKSRKCSWNGETKKGCVQFRRYLNVFFLKAYSFLMNAC